MDETCRARRPIGSTFATSTPSASTSRTCSASAPGPLSRIYKTDECRRNVDAAVHERGCRRVLRRDGVLGREPRHRGQRFGERRSSSSSRPTTAADRGRACRPSGCRRRCRTKARLRPAARTWRCFGTNHVWFATGAGPKARVLRSTDRGATWQIAETPLRVRARCRAPIRSRSATRSHGVIVGGDYVEGSRGGRQRSPSRATAERRGSLVKERGLGGFRSVVAFVPGSKSTFIAIGPSGTDISLDDGRTWSPVEGPGFDTFSFAPKRNLGWGSGARGTIGRLDLKSGVPGV